MFSDGFPLVFRYVSPESWLLPSMPVDRRQVYNLWPESPAFQHCWWRGLFGWSASRGDGWWSLIVDHKMFIICTYYIYTYIYILYKYIYNNLINIIYIYNLCIYIYIYIIYHTYIYYIKHMHIYICKYTYCVLSRWMQSCRQYTTILSWSAWTILEISILCDDLNSGVELCKARSSVNPTDG